MAGRLGGRLAGGSFGGHLAEAVGQHGQLVFRWQLFTLEVRRQGIVQHAAASAALGGEAQLGDLGLLGAVSGGEDVGGGLLVKLLGGQPGVAAERGQGHGGVDHLGRAVPHVHARGDSLHPGARPQRGLGPRWRGAVHQLRRGVRRDGRGLLELRPHGVGLGHVVHGVGQRGGDRRLGLGRVEDLFGGAGRRVRCFVAEELLHELAQGARRGALPGGEEEA